MNLANQTNSSELPEGWLEVSFDQLLQTLESGSRPKGGVRGIKDGIPSIGGEHLNERGGFRFETVKFVPAIFFKRMNRGRIQRGDILIVKDGATTGKVSFVNDEFPYKTAVVNEHVFICRPSKNIFPPFLFYFLFSKEGQDRILENFRGSAQGGINQSFAPGTAIPLAPFAEQKRITAKVEELLGRGNSVRERLARVQIILKRFRQSVLSAACSGRLTTDWRQNHLPIEPSKGLLERIHEERKKKWLEKAPQKGREGKSFKYPPIAEPSPEFEMEFPESWCLASIDELTSRITSGSRDWKRYYRKDGPGTFIMAQNVKSMLFDRSFRLAVDPPQNDRDRNRSEVKKDDILVTIAGNTGQVCRIKDPIKQHYVCQSVALMRPVISDISPYLEIYLNSPNHGQAQYGKWIYGEGRPHLSFEHLRTTAVALPPLEEQQMIAKHVSRLFDLADVVEKRISLGILRAEIMEQATLAKAFRGELVATEAELARREGRSFEPASEIIKRILSGQ
jgi:type I restriction enzyme S subunit